MDKDAKPVFKTPAARRKRENTESVEGSKPRKRKRSEDETLEARDPEVAGPSTSCQPQKRPIKRPKRKVFDEGEGPSTPAKRAKKGLLERVLTNDASSEDVSTETSGSGTELYSTDKGDLRKRNLKRKAEDFEGEPRKKRTKKTKTEEGGGAESQQGQFQKKYVELHQLGQGGFGSVFAGYRSRDKLPVAIKHIPKDNILLKHRDENGRELSLEVAIMLRLRNVTSSVGQSAIVSMLDWYDLEEELIVVMERPMPAEDLTVHMNERGRNMKEPEAKIVLKQLVEAGILLQEARIFHRDIKTENILIETCSEEPRVCLIDFGLSCFDHGRKLSLFYGTPCHIPPEFDMIGKYSAGPTTVWQLGVVLYELLHSKPFETTRFLQNDLKISQRLSRDCQDVLFKCLAKVPEERPDLEELLDHPWFS